MNVIHANETTQLYFYAFIRFVMRRRRYKGLKRSISDRNLNQIKTSHFMFLSWFYGKKTKIMISYFGLKFNRKPTLIFTSLAVQTFSASVQLRWISKIANSLAEAKNFCCLNWLKFRIPAWSRPNLLRLNINCSIDMKFIFFIIKEWASTSFVFNGILWHNLPNTEHTNIFAFISLKCNFVHNIGIYWHTSTASTSKMCVPELALQTPINNI